MTNIKPHMRRAASLLPIFLLGACEQLYHAPILYQAQTPDCRNWADGSSFELPRSIRVFAGSPKAGAGATLEVPLAYFIPRGESVTFTSQTFAVVAPSGGGRVVGTVDAVDRRVSNAPGTKTEHLSSLPLTLVALDSGDETMVRATLLFQSPPKRFDLVHPDMVAGSKVYRVRTYTYRWFEDRKQYGLCT